MCNCLCGIFLPATDIQAKLLAIHQNSTLFFEPRSWQHTHTELLAELTSKSEGVIVVPVRLAGPMPSLAAAQASPHSAHSVPDSPNLTHTAQLSTHCELTLLAPRLSVHEMGLIPVTLLHSLTPSDSDLLPAYGALCLPGCRWATIKIGCRKSLNSFPQPRNPWSADQPLGAGLLSRCSL